MKSKTQKLKKGLYIVSTPIGNLKDITFRAIDILKKSDIILCEDTRNSKKLLTHYEIKSKLVSYHKFNERKISKEIVSEIQKYNIISLISDAGTPVISDPGKILIKECVSKNIPVIPIPGVSSVIATVSISGLSGGTFQIALGGYSNAGQSSWHYHASVGGYMTGTNMYNITEISNWISGGSVSAVSYTHLTLPTSDLV